jgi:hypothetical protein
MHSSPLPDGNQRDAVMASLLVEREITPVQGAHSGPLKARAPRNIGG